MAEKYYTAKEIAERLGITERHARRIAATENWLFIESRAKARNGKSEIKYPLSALPLGLQAKVGGVVAVPKADTPLARMELEPYNRELADARLTTLQLFKRFSGELPLSNGKAVRAFLAEWQAGRIASAELKDSVGSLSARTLYRWQTLYKEGGLTALAPSYGKRRGNTVIPAEFHDFIMTAYLSQNERSARGIYSHIINALALKKLCPSGNIKEADTVELALLKEELSKLFGYRAVIRFIQNNAASGLLKKARGVKSQREKVQAYLSRNPESLNKNSLWVSDGREKKAERTWGTIAEYVEKYLHGYVGRNAEHKPEAAKALAKRGQYIDLEQYKQAVAYGIQMYNTQPHTGMGVEGRPPALAYAADPSPRWVAPLDTIETLRMIVCPNLRTVMGGGRVRLNNREYIAPELLDFIGDKVQIAVDKNNLNIAHIFLDGKFIARAEGVIMADFFDSPNTQAAYKQLAKQKGKEKKLTKELAEIKKKQSQVLLVDKAAAIEAQRNILIEDKTDKKFKRYDY